MVEGWLEGRASGWVLVAEVGDGDSGGGGGLVGEGRGGGGGEGGGGWVFSILGGSCGGIGG